MKLMNKRGWMKELILIVISVVLGGLFSAIFLTGDASLFLESNCPSSFSDDKKIIFIIRNRGDASAFASICLKSENLTFSLFNNRSEGCIEEQIFEKMSTELVRNFDTKVNFVGFDTPKANISLIFSSNCRKKVLGIPIPCEGLYRVCKYRPSGDYFSSIN